MILIISFLFSFKKEPYHPTPAQVVASPTIVTVTDCNLNGWEKFANPATTLAFTSSLSTTILGKGSLEYYTISGAICRIRSTSYNNTLLSSLTELRYSSLVQSRENNSDNIFVVLQIDKNDDGIADDHLIFEPRWQTAPFATGLVPDQGPTLLNTWQSWELLNAIWWEGGPPKPNPIMGGAYYTLADYISKNPTAKIVNYPGAGGTGGIRLNIGGILGYPTYGGINIKANADKFTIGVNGKTNIYDFEPSIANAGAAKIINYGYDSNCTTLHGTFEGGVAPYTYAWSDGKSTWNNQNINVCPTTTTTYSLTATDAKGCTGSDQVTVYVNDVRC